MLPTEPTPKKTKLTEHTVLIYGRPGIGKSTWCSNAPGALFLATEPGLNSLEVVQESVGTWTELLGWCGLLAKGGHKFETVVIDTIDLAYKLCVEHTCKTWNIKHVSDLKWGKGYQLTTDEFQRVIVKLAQMATGLILVSHENRITIDTPTGEYSMSVPTLPGKARDIITGMADITLYCDIETVKDDTGKVTYRRVMRTNQALHYEAKDRTGRLPETVALDYAAFVKAYEDGGKA